MIKIRLLLGLLLTGMLAHSQVLPGATKINSRYEWLGGKFNGLKVPSYGDSTQYPIWLVGLSGDVFLDTAGTDAGTLYARSGVPKYWKPISGAGGTKDSVGFGVKRVSNTLQVDAIGAGGVSLSYVGNTLRIFGDTSGGKSVLVRGGIRDSTGYKVIDTLYTGQKLIYKYSNIAFMRTSAPVDGTTAITAGYITPVDGGGATYTFDAASTATDDSASVLAPDGFVANGIAGRWKLSIDASINAKTFGMTDDNTANDWRALQKAVTFAHVNSKNYEVYIPAGTYSISDSIVVPTGVNIRGAANNGTKIFIGGAGKSMFKITSGTSMSDLQLYGRAGGDTAKNCIVVGSGNRIQIDRVRIEAFTDNGLWINGEMNNSSISNVFAQFVKYKIHVSGGYNIWFTNCNSNESSGSSNQDSTARSILIDSNTRGVYFIGGIFERGPGSHQIEIGPDVQDINFISCEFNYASAGFPYFQRGGQVTMSACKFTNITGALNGWVVGGQLDIIDAVTYGSGAQPLTNLWRGNVVFHGGLEQPLTQNFGVNSFGSTNSSAVGVYNATTGGMDITTTNSTTSGWATGLSSTTYLVRPGEILRADFTIKNITGGDGFVWVYITTPASRYLLGRYPAGNHRVYYNAVGGEQYRLNFLTGQSAIKTFNLSRTALYSLSKDSTAFINYASDYHGDAITGVERAMVLNYRFRNYTNTADSVAAQDALTVQTGGVSVASLALADTAVVATLPSTGKFVSIPIARFPVGGSGGGGSYTSNLPTDTASTEYISRTNVRQIDNKTFGGVPIPSGSLSIYNTGYGNSIYERLRLFTSGNRYVFGSEFGSTGTARPWDFQLGGVNYWRTYAPGGNSAGLQTFFPTLTNSTGNQVFTLFGGTTTAASGNTVIQDINYTDNTSGTGGSIGLRINGTYTGTGSGASKLLQVNRAGTEVGYIDYLGQYSLGLTQRSTNGTDSVLVKDPTTGLVKAVERSLFSAGGVTGTGSTNQITYWSGTSALAGSANFVWDAANSRVGISTASPTAALHLPAGVATASGAPLKLTSGTLLTTPEDGATERDANHIYHTVGSNRYQLDNQLPYVSTGGVANTYTATYVPAVLAYTTGQSIKIKMSVANTGASTINVNGLGAKAITKGNATALASNDLVSGFIYELTYDGTQYVITSFYSDVNKASLSGATFTGAVSTGANNITTTGTVSTGGFVTAQAAKTAAYTTVAADHDIYADATTAAFSVTLLTAVGNAGRQQTIKRQNAGTNNVTVATTSSQTIDGATTFPLTTQYSWVTVTSNGANWVVTGRGGVASYSGTYTPTFTAGTNITAATISAARYNVSGKMVTVSAYIVPTITAANAFSSFTLSLPLAVTTTNAYDVMGSGTYSTTGGNIMSGATVTASANNAVVSFYSAVSNTTPLIIVTYNYLLP